MQYDGAELSKESHLTALSISSNDGRVGMQVGGSSGTGSVEDAGRASGVIRRRVGAGAGAGAKTVGNREIFNVSECVDGKICQYHMKSQCTLTS